MKLPSWLKKKPAPVDPVKPIERVSITALHPATATHFSMELHGFDFPADGDLDLLMDAVVDGLRSHGFKTSVTVDYRGERVKL